MYDINKIKNIPCEEIALRCNITLKKIVGKIERRKDCFFQHKFRKKSLVRLWNIKRWKRHRSYNGNRTL